jgi:hypothetical protein
MVPYIFVQFICLQSRTFMHILYSGNPILLYFIWCLHIFFGTSWKVVVICLFCTTFDYVLNSFLKQTSGTWNGLTKNLASTYVKRFKQKCSVFIIWLAKGSMNLYFYVYSASYSRKTEKMSRIAYIASSGGLLGQLHTYQLLFIL